MKPDTAAVVGLVFAIIGTVLSLVLITPKSRKESLPKFFQFLHDLFNFNFLILEKILKALYVFFTLFTLFAGFFLLFAEEYSYYGYGGDSMAGAGLLVMILGPVIVRIICEAAMLTILLVKNVIEINKKVNGKDDAPEFGTGKYSLKNINLAPKAAPAQAPVQTPVQAPAQPQAPVQPRPAPQAQTTVREAVQPAFVFCTKCGTRYDKNAGGCPNCNQ